MKMQLYLILVMSFTVLLGCKSSVPESKVTDVIRLNSLGFLPGAVKQASLTQDAKKFHIRDAASGKIVFKGKAADPVTQADVNQTIWIADFSQVKIPGAYYLEIPGVGRSTDFSISDKVYNDAYITSMRAFYLWRCGMEVQGDYNGIHYHQYACHLNDGYEDYVGNKEVHRDGTQGWHDAGDYGKYTVNAGVTVGVLFMAWENFQSRLNSISLDLPETASGFPEFLKEMKWEIDWLLKMQYSDGSGRVSHKLTRTSFSGFIMPDKDDGKRYFTEWGSAATASFVAMMAQAARIFEPYDKEYAKKCLDAATVSYRFLVRNPEDKGFVQGDFNTGGYQTSDPDDRIWAAAEMWATTGDVQYLADFEDRARKMDFTVEENWDWGNVSNLGMFTYILSERQGKDKNVEEAIRRNIISVSNQIVDNIHNDVYRRPLPGRYYWGCNGGVARQTVNLFVADKLSPDKKYENAALDIIGHLFGRNYYNRSYITGLGINPPMFPHDRRSAADNIADPWPGYIVGGGHTATDWIDEEGSFSHNEVAINWQAPLVFALGWFVQK
ncbi:glycoside hydrolase family 9 protein [Bacteroides sp. 51]|uniref:glycoside hydrolase family 9 protein n=1 Tax=Bacteroides sp. 51 TaxID=2302938 RepID=UPI0013CF845E|nr:glycoside hydrolase family 9 protein [Bacteroides sp. 51]NDV82557.1 endoglucanase [Bacteroides sp. 51]